MTISSSLPLASHRPEWAQRTVSTGPVCIDSVHSDFGGLPDSSLAGLSIGFVLQIRTLASRPPVAMREPSGWTCTENMDRRFGFESLFAESLWMTHAGLVKCMVESGCFRLWLARAVFGNHILYTYSIVLGFCLFFYFYFYFYIYVYWRTGSRIRIITSRAQSDCNDRAWHIAWSRLRYMVTPSCAISPSPHAILIVPSIATGISTTLIYISKIRERIRALVWLPPGMSWSTGCRA